MKIIHSQRKHFLWLPYTSTIDIKGSNVSFTYKGGIEETSFVKIHSIMFYGSVIDLSQKFLETCTKYKIPITIHRRNMTRATWIAPNFQTNVRDLFSKQILVRENKTKQKYIARMLLKAKFKSMDWLVESDQELNSQMTLEELRNIEALHAKKYWTKYYKELGYQNWQRRTKNPVSTVLDAISKYISGILLRWILYHNLSPYHGYLHVQTEYPALVYDLIEPYRGYFDLVVFKTIKKCQAKNKPESDWLPACINELKSFLYSQVYTDATRQIVSISELIHGIVLAFRSYLIGDSQRFIVPTPCSPNGGRPKKAGYKLYGRQAGRTDFWSEAKLISSITDKYYLKPEVLKQLN